MSEPRTRKVRLRIGRRDPIPFTIPDSPDVEKHLRRGALELNRLLNKYESAYPEASDEEVMTFAAIHLANDLAALRDAFEGLALEETLSGLVKEIDDAPFRD